MWYISEYVEKRAPKAGRSVRNGENDVRELLKMLLFVKENTCNVLLPTGDF